jgi:hypothetical protein
MGYGVWASGAVLRHDIVTQRLFSAVFTRDGVRVPATWWVVAQYLLGQRTEVCMVGIICVVMGAIVVAFFFYHVWLAAGSVTTNESFKWSDLRDMRAHFVRRYELGERYHGIADAAVERARKAGDEKALAEATATKAELLAKVGPPGQPPPAPVPPNRYSKGALANLWAMLVPPTPAKWATPAAPADSAAATAAARGPSPARARSPPREDHQKKAK